MYFQARIQAHEPKHSAPELKTWHLINWPLYCQAIQKEIIIIICGECKKLNLVNY